MSGTEPPCVCCERNDAAIDPSSGLCLYCQPCERCGKTGTGCYQPLGDGTALTICTP